MSRQILNDTVFYIIFLEDTLFEFLNCTFHYFIFRIFSKIKLEKYKSVSKDNCITLRISFWQDKVGDRQFLLKLCFWVM